MLIPTSLCHCRLQSGGKENKILTAADTIWAEIPFKSECRITDPWSEKESGNFFFLKKRGGTFKTIKKKVEKAGSQSSERPKNK